MILGVIVGPLGFLGAKEAKELSVQINIRINATIIRAIIGTMK
jgi:hypothetical protein|tara:strand:- start:95 stop:223 length:129 start_codon:yes stop_codon:yes gene_type:complete